MSSEKVRRLTAEALRHAMHGMDEIMTHELDSSSLVILLASVITLLANTSAVLTMIYALLEEINEGPGLAERRN
jgi:uncharacterized membrane protein